MPLLTTVGRKSPRARLLVAAFYVLLTLGGLTMVYPFLIMISGAMKGVYNGKQMDICPRYLYDDMELYRAYCESRYANTTNYNNTSDRPSPDFDSLDPRPLQPRLAEEFRAFLREQPPAPEERLLGHFTMARGNGRHDLGFISYLSDTYGGDVARMNRELGTQFNNWSINLVQESVFFARITSIESNLLRKFFEYRAAQATEDFYEPTADAWFRGSMIFSRYGDDTALLREKLGITATHTGLISLDAPETGNAEYRSLREIFMRRFLNARFIRLELTPEVRRVWRDFLRANFKGSLQALRDVYPAATDFDSLEAPASLPREKRQAVLYASFIEKECPFAALRVEDIQTRFRDRLIAKHGSLEGINRSLGLAARDLSELMIPRGTLDWEYTQAHKGSLRWYLTTRNFEYVFSYIFAHGRAAWVTLTFCTLSILCSLVVNPLAAYALSRFALPSTYKVLLFLMTTMAFPGAVTQIPSFLLLKDLGLLNTFWALVLPGLANGYSIFILKGFFDSLPKELYESASLDGASEFRLFWTLTMNLSKPILALISLNAFTAAYGAFMYALLICQDESMWTIMVYLYQLQGISSQNIIYASLIIAAIPTFVIFVTCQKVILRGIVVPSEK